MQWVNEPPYVTLVLGVNSCHEKYLNDLQIFTGLSFSVGIIDDTVQDRD